MIVLLLNFWNFFQIVLIFHFFFFFQKLENPSKRITASKRYKIEKRVRQHNKKQRAKDKLKSKCKNLFNFFFFEVWNHFLIQFNSILPARKPKADPGIPNLFPFKDKVLKEAEEAKKNVYSFNFFLFFSFSN